MSLELGIANMSRTQGSAPVQGRGRLQRPESAHLNASQVLGAKKGAVFHAKNYVTFVTSSYGAKSCNLNGLPCYESGSGRRSNR